MQEQWDDFLKGFLGKFIDEQYSLPKGLPGKSTCQRILLFASSYMSHAQSKATIARLIAVIILQSKAMSKAEKDAWNTITETYEFLDVCDQCKKKEVWPTLVKAFMTAMMNGKQLERCWSDVEATVEERAHWFATEEPIKPREFLQAKLKGLEATYGGLEFDRTEKTAELKCSKKDAWKLEDAGCKDPFLVSYTNFTHCQKYLSGFVNSDYLCSDGRVRGRFGLVATGRTSCSRPNLQQYPSRDLPKSPLNE